MSRWPGTDSNRAGSGPTDEPREPQIRRGPEAARPWQAADPSKPSPPSAWVARRCAHRRLHEKRLAAQELPGRPCPGMPCTGMECARQRPASLRRTVSWQLQLRAVDPTMLPVFGFHSIPIRRRNEDYHLRSRIQRLQIGGAVKRSRLELGARGLDDPLQLTAQVLDVLFQA